MTTGDGDVDGGEAVEHRELLAEAHGSDEEFPPAPAGFYRGGEPERHTNGCRLLLVVLAIGTACVVVAALIAPPRRVLPDPGHMVLSAMDRSADPCKNFYEYACGSWLRKKEIPPDRSVYSRSFSEVYDDIRLKIRTLLDDDLQRPGNPHAMAGTFYAACMENIAEGPTDITPLTRFKPALDGLKDSVSFASALAILHSSLSAGMFSSGVGVDEKEPTRYTFYVSQGGLGLSHRDKYTSMKDEDVKLRAAYLRLIGDHLRVAGRARLVERRGYAEMAKQAFSFEKELASKSRPPEAMRKPEENYNPLKIAEFPEGIAIQTYLRQGKVNIAATNDTIVVDSVKYINDVSSMMGRVKDDVAWRKAAKAYLAFHLIRHFAGNGIMGADLYNKNFEFKKLVYGVKQIPEKWKRCQAMTSRYVGDQLGAAFVTKHFSPMAKKRAKKLAVRITTSFGKSLASQDWMDDQTRSRAKKKLDAINWKVGYTTKFDTYPGLRISKTAFGQNVIGAMRYAVNYDLNRLGKPIDKTEWSMNSFEVNAYYSATRNEMVFPAGILQKPFFSERFPDAMNYGSIGAVIGHEMSHGFDDQGRKYDASGRLTPWWSPESAKRYVGKTKCFVDLYDTYKPRQTSLHVLGNLTLGENLADTNGVKVAFHAFKRSGVNNSDATLPAPNPVLANELTNHKLFFVAYAQTWCTKYRPRALELQMKTDPHSPGEFRVLGPLSQNPDFAQTFGCKVGTPYNPTSRCSLW